VGVGTATPSNKLAVNSTTAILPSQIQVSHGTGDWGIVVKRNTNDVGTSNFAFLKTRDEAGTTPLTQGDSIGRIAWHAVTNGTGPVTQHLAEIGCVNTTFTGGNADGSLLFWTKKTTDTGPVERMRIDPSGNVGIGTTTTAYFLEVSNSTSTTSTSFLGLTNPFSFAFNAGLNIGSSIVYSSRWQGDALSGVVEMCKIDGRKENSANFGDSYLAFQTRYATDRVNGGAGTLTEKMRITGSGNVGIGTTTPTSYTLQVTGTIGASQDITAFTSDERLKTKTGYLVNALDKVCTLDTFTYKHNDLARSFGFTDNRQYVGVSAQQVRKVQPEVVRMAPFDADGEKSKSGEDYMTVQYERLVPLLIEALKEERKAREALEERVKLLEQK
jgi:hypothetical protein